MITHAAPPKTAPRRVLDWTGAPFPRPAAARPELVEAMLAHRAQRPRRDIEARYDAAQNSDEFKNYWAAADSLSADAAHSPAVRDRLVKRSRYEIANNGYADGIALTYAADLVGTGPVLRMQSGSEPFNRMVEATWSRWSQAVLLRRRLRCMAEAKHRDGETFAVVRTNPGVRHAVQLEPVLYETEQVSSPHRPTIGEGFVDGIRFDAHGNPLSYDVLPAHPGGGNGAWNTLHAEQVPAEYMLHWFLLRRPGQHRGVPETASTLNLGASARRWREATVGAAETAADIAVLLTTSLTASDEADPVAPLSTIDFQKRMMTALPLGWDGKQMKGEHPNATYKDFHRQLINEQARPRQMPYGRAAADHADYNFASGRLDSLPYTTALDVDRADCNDLVLDPLFRLWWQEAVIELGWLGGNPLQLSEQAAAHSWDWPKHRIADIKAEAQAIDIRLKNGALSLSRAYSEAGIDFEDELRAMARDFGVDEDTMRARLLDHLFPAANSAVPAAAAPPVSEEPDET